MVTNEKGQFVKKKLNEEEIQDLIHKYVVEKTSLSDLCSFYHTSKPNLKQYLISNGIEIINRGQRKELTVDSSVLKTEYTTNGLTMEEISIKYNFPVKRLRKVFKENNIEKPLFSLAKNDFMTRLQKDKIYEFQSKLNPEFKIIVKDRYVTKIYNYLRENGINRPTIIEEQHYFKIHGCYWFEEYFEEFKEIEKKPTHKCVYCDWETEDITNKDSGYRGHLLHKHNKTLKDLEKDFPEEMCYFKVHRNKVELEKLMSDEENYVICAICGEKLQKITQDHLNKHNLLLYEYKEKYGSVISNKIKKQIESIRPLAMASEHKQPFTSKLEKEVAKLLEDNDVEFETNRRRIGGVEFDIIVEDKKLCIELNGVYWHSNKFKNAETRHLTKTLLGLKHGYGVIQIFEDEMKYKKPIVFDKIKHLLGINTENVKIGARKLIVKEIKNNTERDEFLNKNHIQGTCGSTYCIGGYYKNELVCLMSFKRNKNNSYELNRYTTKINYLVQGGSSKLLSYFIKNYNPKHIYSFADRRWTTNHENNLYTKLGFELTNIVKPTYTYFKPSGNNYIRHHKFNFRKQILLKKYPELLTSDMTEREMTEKLGYYRVWDCGLFKYELIIE